ncbi:hypothetical protein AB4Y32_21020 [Paraburkholderia phymatum]|uniref:Uncharacterized protein n=1 Tax=Paraburkholderia phymatum TaxID=148447 RepID=A0ACC6U3F7_9BURK
MARTRILSLLALCIAATCLAAGAALLVELLAVSRAVSEFSLDETRERARIAHDGRITLDERLNPAYLKRYNLDPRQYTDSQGHFSPTRADWQRWRLRTQNGRDGNVARPRPARHVAGAAANQMRRSIPRSTRRQRADRRRR